MNKKRFFAAFISTVLCLTTVLSMCIVTTPAAVAPMAKPIVTTSQNPDGTFLVTISAYGNMEGFDYGIVFDNKKVKVATDEEGYALAEWDAAFQKSYTGPKSKGIMTFENLDSHVVFGGTTKDSTYTYNGIVCYVNFKLLEGVELPGEFSVVLNSGRYKNELKIPLNLTTAFENDKVVPKSMIPAAPYTIRSSVAADGTISVAIDVIGDMTFFDYGIVFDQDLVSFEDFSWNPDFLKLYSKYKGIETFEEMTENDNSYIVLGGTASKRCSYKGTVAELTFKKKAEAKSIGSFTLVPNSAKYKNYFSVPLNTINGPMDDDAYVFVPGKDKQVTPDETIRKEINADQISQLFNQLQALLVVLERVTTNIYMNGTSDIDVNNLNLIINNFSPNDNAELFNTARTQIQNTQGIITDTSQLNIIDFSAMTTSGAAVNTGLTYEASVPVIKSNKTNGNRSFTQSICQLLQSILISGYSSCAEVSSTQEPILSADGNTATFKVDKPGTYAFMAKEIKYLLGDSNSDNDVNLKDANATLKHALLISKVQGEENLLAIDANEDKSVNLKDANLILKAALKINPLN